MKYLLILSIFVTGCATVSEYNQGCRDGIRAAAVNPELRVDENKVNPFCDSLEQLHKERSNMNKN